MTDTLSRLAAALADRYRIQRELGAGGMATVYLAEDLKHDRRVAIKVLKPELAAVIGAERFLAEIRTTANLQHPHILPLFDSGEAGGFLFYVMPYLDGESLQDRINREKELPVDVAVALARKIADALDYAHEQGVVHRDIKPANILLSERGEPLVADFGIALAVSQAGAGRVTETGLSVGTPHYMSPEQATGDRDVDPRSDVYALGCVLFEMLVGQPPFAGHSAQAVLARILTENPQPVTQYRKSVPAHVEAVIATALERLPADRFSSARAFAEALANPAFRGTGSHAVLAAAARAAGPWRTRFFAAAAVAVLATVTALAVAVDGEPEAPLPEPVRFIEPLDFTVYEWTLSVSPTGERISAFSGFDGRARIRTLGVPGTTVWDGMSIGATWLPDGDAFLAFTSATTLEAIPLDGSPPVEFRVDGPNDGVSGLIAGTDGFAYLGTNAVGQPSAIFRFPLDGGPRDTVLVGETQGQAGFPTAYPQFVLPDGSGLVYSQEDALDGQVFGLYLLDLETGESQALLPGEVGNGRAFWMEAGYILFSREGSILAVAFDPNERRITGEPRPVVSGGGGVVAFAYGGGVLATATNATLNRLRLAILDRGGRAQPLPDLPRGTMTEPAVSPDGRRIALTFTPQDGEGDVWSLELPDGPLTRVSLDGGARATWTPDGRELYYVNGGNLYRRVRDGTRPAEMVLDLPEPITRVSPTPSGDSLFLQVQGPAGWDIVLHTLGSAPTTRPFLNESFSEGHPAVSPDGRWLAYYSDESGAIEIYIRSLGENPARVQVSRNTGTGAYPRWSSTGEELFFWENAGGTSSVGAAGVLRAALRLDADDPRVLGVERMLAVSEQTFSVFPGDSLFAVAALPAEEDGNGIATGLEITVNFETVVRRIMAQGGSRP